jgi:hypothetical protein
MLCGCCTFDCGNCLRPRAGPDRCDAVHHNDGKPGRKCYDLLYKPARGAHNTFTFASQMIARMKQRSITPMRRHRRAITFAATVSPLVLLVADVAAQTNVYRCTTPAGAVEFRQFPCADGSDEEALVIKDRKTGWTPATPETGATTKAAGKPRKRKQKSTVKGDSSRARREERCWKKRQLLEEVNWKLRRGYKTGQGVTLRRRRQAYDDYIDHYCN